MIFTGNHNRRRAQQNGQNNSQRRRSSNIEVRGGEYSGGSSTWKVFTVFTLSNTTQLHSRPEARHHRDYRANLESRQAEVPTYPPTRPRRPRRQVTIPWREQATATIPAT